MRTVARVALRSWRRIPKAQGYFYRAVERWGASLARAPLRCRLFNGVEVECDLRDHVQRHMYFFGAYEPVESHLFRTLLRPGMVVVDVGANVGQYTLVAAEKLRAPGAVHTFEPVPRTFDHLLRHVTANGFGEVVTCTRAALWHRAETLTLTLGSHMRDNAGAYTAGEVDAPIDAVTCPAVRLDDYVRERDVRRVDVVKIDVEGAELFVLQGALDTLRRWRPLMLMEINRTLCARMGYEAAAIWRLLEPLGYRIWSVSYSAATSAPLPTLDGIERANVILHTAPLPPEIVGGWSAKSIRAGMRAGARRGA